MSMRCAVMVAGLALGMMSEAATAAVIVDVTEVGGNVLFSGTGSLNLTGLSFQFSSNSGGSLIVPNTASFIIGDEGGDIDLYSGASRPGSFGSGSFHFADSNTGSSFGYGNGDLFVPAGYKSGDAINSTSLFTNSTLKSLGLKNGTYKYAWSSDSVTLNIGPVPLPSSAPMFGIALISLASFGYTVKRKKVSSVA